MSCGCGQRRTIASSRFWFCRPSLWGSPCRFFLWWRRGNTSRCCGRLNRCEHVGQSHLFLPVGSVSADGTEGQRSQSVQMYNSKQKWLGVWLSPVLAVSHEVSPLSRWASASCWFPPAISFQAPLVSSSPHQELDSCSPSLSPVRQTNYTLLH